MQSPRRPVQTLALTLAFWFLVAVTLARGRSLAPRGAPEWALDGIGLIVQGLVVPFLQLGMVFAALAVLAPPWRGALGAPPWVSFLLNFVVVDYAYYWNHRLLHGPLWRWHAVHHTAEAMDVIVTARNTLWTPLLIVYVWLNGLGAYLLADPAPFLISAALTAGLDMWRHSGAYPQPGEVGRRAYEGLSRFVITPEDHAWHHSTDRTDTNFGANLKIWDLWHGTYDGHGEAPRRLGVELAMTAWRKLLLGGEPAA